MRRHIAEKIRTRRQEMEIEDLHKRMNTQQANSLRRVAFALDLLGAQIKAIKTLGREIPENAQKQFDELKETAVSYLHAQLQLKFSVEQDWAEIKKEALDKYPTLLDEREEPGARTK